MQVHTSQLHRGDIVKATHDIMEIYVRSGDLGVVFEDVEHDGPLVRWIFVGSRSKVYAEDVERIE